MENYFREALHNFIFEEAGGGAIRHLADKGYTARQIADALSFPMPYEKVREAYTGYLLESGILLKEEPKEYRRPEKTEYVREYDKYGKPSFRKVVVSEGTSRRDLTEDRIGGLKWKEMDLSEFLLLYKEGTSGIKLPAETEHREAEKNVYIACNFGIVRTAEELQKLDKGQREYIQGICWTKKTMYHLLDKRMLRIAVKMKKMERTDEHKSVGERIEEYAEKGVGERAEKRIEKNMGECAEKSAREKVAEGSGYAAKTALIGKVYIRH